VQLRKSAADSSAVGAVLGAIALFFSQNRRMIDLVVTGFGLEPVSDRF
jgi:hypothetical protein